MHRIFLKLIFVVLVVSCKGLSRSNVTTSNKFVGLWTACVSGYCDGIWFFSPDTLTTVALQGFTLKYKYKIVDESKIRFRPYKGHLIANEKYKWYTYKYSFKNDSLKITGLNNFHLSRSNFDNYYEHFANDSLISIKLPNTTFTRSINYGPVIVLDIFVGKGIDQKTVIKVNENIVSDYDDLRESIVEFKTDKASEHPFHDLWCRFFIDESIDIGTIFDIQLILGSNDIRRILYVSKGPGHQSYKTRFSGMINYLK